MSPRNLFAALLAAVALLAVVVSPAAAGNTLSFKAVKAKGGTVVFNVKGVAPKRVRSGRIKVGCYRRKLAVRRLQRGVRRGRLQVRVPRRVAKQIRRAASPPSAPTRQGGSGSGSPAQPAPAPSRPTLIVVTQPEVEESPVLPTGPVNGRLSDFESGDFAGVDGRSTTGNAGLSISTEKVYDGSKAAKITYDGQPGNVFSRTWYSVDWQPGEDVWYGAAFYVPDPSKLRYTDLIRWDNYVSYEGGGDVGGLLVEDGQMSMMRDDYSDHSTFARVTPQVAVPKARWFWVEVHQRLSSVNGQALTEMYLDGRKVGSSTRANSMGRRIDEVRYGYVYNWDEGGASTLYMDRVSQTDGMRGPVR